MRVSGAIKSILHGVTTANLTNADSEYFKSQVNTLPRIDEGLVKRPPAELIGSMGAAIATDGTEFVKDFVIHDVAYFLVVRTTGLEVYREDGQKYTVTDTSDMTYLASITEDDLDLVVQGEQVFILNKTQTVAMLPDDSTIFKHSTIWFKGPTEYGTQLWVTAINHLGTPVTYSHTVPTTPIYVQGADVVAFAIAALFNADANFTATSRGATCVIIRNDGEPTEITCSTTIGQDHVVVMNGVVDTVDDLPNYGYDWQRTQVKVREDSDKGSFYMQARAEASYNEVPLTPPTWPTADLVSKTPGWYYWNGPTWTATTPPNGTVQKFLSIESPGSLNGATVERILLGNSTLADQSDFVRSVQVQFFQSQVPIPSNNHRLRFSTTADTTTTIYQSDFTSSTFGAPATYLWNDDAGGGPHVPAPFNSSTAYNLWVDAGVNGATAGDLVEVRWDEVAEATVDKDFNANTMPHVLRPTGGTAGGFPEMSFSAVAWDTRAAGDDVTNPKPAFVDKTIEDITIFQNRLAVISGDQVSMTESQNVFNWFRDTNTQLLSKHPIGIRSTSPASSKLFHFVFHNRDLLVTAGRQQFKISGDKPITPQTASMPQTTSYNASERISPVSLGNSVYIPNHFGNYLNVSKYDGSNQNLEPDAADNITQHCRKFIQGAITKLHGLPNHGLIFAHDSVGSEIYICNYDTELSRSEVRRYAWMKWNDFTDTTYNIAALSTSKNKLVAAYNTSLGLQLLEFDMDAGSAKKYLDYQLEATSVNTTIDVGTDYGLALADIVVVQGEGCPEPGDYVDTVSLVAGILTIDTDMGGGTVHVGHEFTVEMEPNLLQARDEGGFVNNAADLRINQFIIDLVDTAIMTAQEQSPYDTYEEQEFSGIVSNSLDAITDEAVTTTDKFLVGFRQKANVGTILIKSTTWLPMTVTQVEWRGNYTSRGRRF
ncbi:MAG: hypothetical protein GY799_19745 [Desulfobulbaceae bacterium]|nr:hypothetical protein [Desulfobulbaceae bacterium]